MRSSPIGRRTALRRLLRRGRTGRLTGLLVCIAAAGGAPAAYAGAIAGATYTGIAADGATVGFTVSPDGTLVDSYRIGNSSGDTCTFYAGGDKGAWEGAPITGGAFSYTLGSDALVFRGSFSGPQSASGTFQFHNPASGGVAECKTGVVTWTATTTATPPAGPGAGGGNGRGNGSGNGKGNGGDSGRPQFATRVGLRKLGPRRLGGSISSPVKACRARRTMVLWRGAKRIGSTRVGAGGRYWFARAARLRGKRVRVTVLARSVPAGVCAAGSSKFIRA